MSFTLTQIGVTFISFLATFILAIWWHFKDKNAEKRESDIESFPVLMSVFFWAAFGALALKMEIDFWNIFFPEAMKTEAVFIATLFGEELVKAVALIVGLNMAGKRFNETSDGVMYSVFAALGFIFFENIFYLIAVSPNIYDFFIVLLGRNIFSFAAHLSIVIFGVFYAAAYLHTSKDLEKKLNKRKEHRVAPYEIHKMLRFLWKKYNIFIVLWLPLSPLVLLFQTVRAKQAHITMSEMILGGFIFSTYVHIIYDYALDLAIPWVNTLLFIVIGILAVVLHHFFPTLDVD